MILRYSYVVLIWLFLSSLPFVVKNDLSDEETGWGITEKELEERRTAAVEKDGLEIRALTIINPGNPTGQVLSREDLEIIYVNSARNTILCYWQTKSIRRISTMRTRSLFQRRKLRSKPQGVRIFNSSASTPQARD